MSEKTNSGLEQEIKVRDHLEKERGISDARYAIKLVEKIVFTLVALLATAVVVALINIVIVNSKT